MRQVQHVIEIRTQGHGLIEITGEIGRWLESQIIGTGLLTVFCRHTSASIIIQETGDRDVRQIWRDSSTVWSRRIRHSIATREKGRMICPRTFGRH